MLPLRVLGAFYFCISCALALYIVYFPLYLASRDVSAATITPLLAAFPAAKAFASPWVGRMSDAWHARTFLLRALSALSLVAFLFIGLAHGNVPLLAVATVVFALVCTPIIALLDASVLELTGLLGLSYGRIRLFGSAGYVAGLLGGGFVLEDFGAFQAFIGVGVMLGLMALLSWAVPPSEGHSAEERLVPASRAAARWLFLVVVLVAECATTIYDCSFSLVLSGEGRGARYVGFAMSIAVLSEMLFMALSGRILMRIPVRRLFPLTMAVAVVRWLLLAWVTNTAAILSLQVLHGITFGLFIVCGVTLAGEQGDERSSNTNQASFASALSFGSVVGMSISGPLLAHGGRAALFICAAAFSGTAWMVSSVYARFHHRATASRHE